YLFSGRRRHTSSKRDWSSDVCSSDLAPLLTSGPAGAWASGSAPGAGDRPPLGVAGGALQADHGPVSELLGAAGPRIGEGGAHPGGDLIEQVLDPAGSREVHARGGDALLEQALAGSGEGILGGGAVGHGPLRGHPEVLLVAASLLIGAHVTGRFI